MLKITGFLLITIIALQPVHAADWESQNPTPSSQGNRGAVAQGPMRPGMGNDLRITGGLGLLVSNDYRGADSARFIPLPYVDVQYGRFFFNPGRGLGATLINWRDKAWSYELSAAIAPQFSNRDSGDIPGLNAVDIGIESRITGSLGYKNFQAFGTWSESLFGTGHNGTTFDFGLAFRTRFQNGTILRIGPQTRWISDRVAQAFYRVSGPESAASGLDRFRTSSGLEQVSLNSFLLKPINRKWSIVAIMEAGYMLDKFADSPVVETRFQGSLITAVTYRF